MKDSADASNFVGQHAALRERLIDSGAPYGDADAIFNLLMGLPSTPIWQQYKSQLEQRMYDDQITASSTSALPAVGNIRSLASQRAYPYHLALTLSLPQSARKEPIPFRRVPLHDVAFRCIPLHSAVRAAVPSTQDSIHVPPVLHCPFSHIPCIKQAAEGENSLFQTGQWTSADRKYFPVSNGSAGGLNGSRF